MLQLFVGHIKTILPPLLCCEVDGDASINYAYTITILTATITNNEASNKQEEEAINNSRSSFVL
jgi:hypothetical protein